METITIGILLAFVAMFCWGFGDFFIQKSTRKLGDWESLFAITLFGAIILTFFVYPDIPALFSFHYEFFIMLAASAIMLVAALLDFEALKKGKLSVVEPIWAFEIPVASLLAFSIMKESVTLFQGFFILLLIIGLILVSLKSEHFTKKAWLEKGVFLALIAALFMGAANFFIGWGSRESDALMMNWFLNTFIALATLIYLAYTKRMKKLFRDISKNKGVVFSMCFLDNAAWVAFAFAMVLAPISIAVALSESYIIIAVLLGMYVNREFLRKHQKFGIALAIISAIILAYITI